LSLIRQFVSLVHFQIDFTIDDFKFGLLVGENRNNFAGVDRQFGEDFIQLLVWSESQNVGHNLSVSHVAVVNTSHSLFNNLGVGVGVGGGGGGSWSNVGRLVHHIKFGVFLVGKLVSLNGETLTVNIWEEGESSGELEGFSVSHMELNGHGNDLTGRNSTDGVQLHVPGSVGIKVKIGSVLQCHLVKVA
jgi:hypothetical protein